MYLSTLRVYFKVEVYFRVTWSSMEVYSNRRKNQHCQRWIYCWPEGFNPWLMNLQLFAHKLIKWLPGKCADWFFDNIMTWSYCLHRRYSMSRQKNSTSTLVNEHVLNREPVPLNWHQALLLLLLFFVSLAREGKNNACYIHLTSRQPLPRLHNLMFAWPAMLLANQHFFWNKKYRLESTTNGWRYFGQLEQHKSSVLFPIQSEKSPDSSFFACDLWSWLHAIPNLTPPPHM